MVDDRLLLSERFQVHPHVLEQIRDEVGLRLHLVHGLAPSFDDGDLVLGLTGLCQQVLHLPAEGGDVITVVGDELQIRLAARADLVDVVHLGLHRCHDGLTLGQCLHLQVDVG